MEKVYDVVIIGAGPAGLSAGIYASRARLKTLVIEKKTPGGQAASTEHLENYPGYFQQGNGAGLMKKMKEHASHFGCLFVKDEVCDVKIGQDLKILQGKKGEYAARTLIVAVGSQPRTLGVAGEEELTGKGVSYCATCDADLFQDLDLVVVGSGNAALEEALYLARFAAQVAVISVHSQGNLDAEGVIRERALEHPRIKFIWESMVEEIRGGDSVEAVVLKDLKTGRHKSVKTDGVFIYIGSVPQTEFLRSLLELPGSGHIPTNEKMETQLAGVFAAGDVRQKPLRQVVTAAADGAVAAVAADEYIHQHRYYREQIQGRDRPLALFFWSPRDKDSVDMIPVAEDFAAAHSGQFDFLKICVDRGHLVVDKFEVDSVPQLVFVHREDVVARVSGRLAPSRLEKILTKLPGGKTNAGNSQR